MSVIYRDDHYSLTDDNGVVFESDGVFYRLKDGSEKDTLLIESDKGDIYTVSNFFSVDSIVDAAANRTALTSGSGKPYSVKELFDVLSITLNNGGGVSYDFSLMESLKDEVSASKQKKKGKGERALGVIFSVILFLFLRVETWLCSLPMWITLILHFTIGLPIIWFWLTLIVWILVGVVRFLILLFARWGKNSPQTERENKNPYSIRGVNTKKY